MVDELDGAPTIDMIRLEVQKLLKEREDVILVGHSLHNDLLALGLPFPTKYIDTSNLRFLSTSTGTPQSLANLLKTHLNISIRKAVTPGKVTPSTSPDTPMQSSSIHSSLEDAASTMKLFLQYQNHPEGIVADSTAKIFDLKVEIQKRE